MNKPRLLVLGERPRNLPHHFAGRISAVGEIIAVRCKHADLAFDQRVCQALASRGHGRSAGRILDDHGADAIAPDAIKQSGETWACLNGVRSGHRRIIKPVDDHEAMALAIGVDIARRYRASLSLSAPTFVAELVRM